jgi:choline dehydrogenase-like flavoprotein
VIIDYLDGAVSPDIEADLCIIGAGPAGLAIAHAFIGTQVRVCVVESGGFAGEARNQALYEGDSIGRPEFDPALSRLRAFGGSCNLWGGGCIPLTAQDFGPREWVPHSGWPLSYQELEPHYRRALEFCRIGPQDFTEGSFLRPPLRDPLDFDRQTLVNRLFVSTPIIFGEAYRQEFRQAANVTILLHANLVELEPVASGGSVQRARIRSLDGRDGTVRARQYVLACGGIENARLLLLSDSVVANGLGNTHDLVGRYFMDHPTGKLGTLSMDDPYHLTRPYDRSVGNGPVPTLPEICLSDEAIRAHKLLNGRARPVAVEALPPKGIRALRSLRAALRKPVDSHDSVVEDRVRIALTKGETLEQNAAAQSTASIGKLALQVGLGAPDIGIAFGRKLAGKSKVKIDHVDLIGFFEQAPNPDSRITLGEETDVLGQRKVRVDWQLTELDRRTYRATAELFGKELTRTCGGRFQPEPWITDDDDTLPLVRSTAHHIGTTRMSDDPATGVVDSQCRVHGIDNLHVVGSSVFPTGGWAFPTFTIVALSLRLAEHLRVHMNELVHLVA